MSQTTLTTAAGSTAPARLTWRCWPLVDYAPWSWLLPLALAGAAVLVERSTGSVQLGLLSAVVLAVSAWRFLLPVQFAMSERGVTQRVLGRVRHVPWKAIRAYEVRNAGVLLFRVDRPLALDAFRGLYVPWKQHRAEVLEFLERKDERKEG